jgi:phage terminase large subunit
LIQLLKVFKPAWTTTKRYVIKVGGRGGGKSHDEAYFHVIKCRQPEYYRGVLVREIHSTIRDSQFSEIKSAIDSMGIGNEFIIRENIMEFEHRITGNKILSKGLKKSSNKEEAKFKSIKDPTHVWFEELPDASEEDFLKVDESVRTQKAEVLQIRVTMNTDIPPDHWIRKRFFDVERDDTEIVWSTYLDNYINLAPSYIEMMENMKETDYERWKVSAKGEWGRREVKNPFSRQFDYFKHVKPCSYQPLKELRINFDFNISPFAITFSHFWRDNEGYHYHTFDEATIEDGTIDKACDYIYDNYRKSLHLAVIHGDYSATKRDISQRDHANLYQLIQRKLKLNNSQFKLKPNPRHTNSRSDVNYLFMHFPDLRIDPRCKNLISDHETVEINEKGQIIKAQRSQKSQRADHLDAFRYCVNSDGPKGWIEAN